jgi:subfamily B ATP-binding cassette protein MsbA
MPGFLRFSILRDLTSGATGRLLREHVLPQFRWLLVSAACMGMFAAATACQAWIMEPVLDRVFLEGDRQILIRADLAYIVESGPGPLISRLTYDTQQLRLAVSSALTTAARDLLTLLFLMGLMFHQDWRLAALATIGLPVAFWPVNWLGRRMRQISRQRQTHMSRLTARLEQIFSGARQVKAENREGDESARTGALIEQQFRYNFRASRVSAIATPTMEVLGGLAVAAVVLYGGWQVLAGQTTPGALFAFIAALLFAYRPLRTVATQLTEVQAGVAAAERIYALLDRKPLIGDRPGAMPLTIGAGEIHFVHVRFGYRPTRPALRGLNLVIPAGRTIALVGPSGAGKSTMLNLILRFYDVDEGAVLIDGQDVRSVTLASLRGALALVSQEVDLFDDTVRANVAYGRPGASDAEVVAAAKGAVAHDFICALPDGYDTMIGPSGASLSGGQRQRLGIARAMLKDAPILLLDEATSALDSEAERAVQTALRRLMRGRTTVVIAHRLSTVIGADLIAVLEEGRVVDTGTHRSLLARGGSYARLYQQQFADQLATLDDAIPAAVGLHPV